MASWPSRQASRFLAASAQHHPAPLRRAWPSLLASLLLPPASCLPASTPPVHTCRGYFKKALLEAESEWSTHHAKAVIDTTAQKVGRRAGGEEGLCTHVAAARNALCPASWAYEPPVFSAPHSNSARPLPPAPCRLPHLLPPLRPLLLTLFFLLCRRRRRCRPSGPARVHSAQLSLLLRPGVSALGCRALCCSAAACICVWVCVCVMYERDVAARLCLSKGWLWKPRDREVETKQRM